MLEWDDKYSVGISIIDEEHKKLIGIMNKAIALEQDSSNPKEITEVLNEMNIYVNTHFATEEAYMVKFNYPDYENHRKEHQAFSIETMAFIDKMTNTNRQLICEIIGHLKSLLVNHVLGTDTKYISCFKEHGLK
ncbi:MAG: bacteriohemerythrin [Planctomycetota bacterium]|jgi:hemerythrin